MVGFNKDMCIFFAACLVSYGYDTSILQHARIKPTKNNNEFVCTMVMDRQMHDEERAKSKRMLCEQVQAGAQVFTAQRETNRKHPRFCHIKTVVSDGKAVYAGCPNGTDANDKRT